MYVLYIMPKQYTYLYCILNFQVFVIISFYCQLKITMAIFFNQALWQSVEILVSIKRIQVNTSHIIFIKTLYCEKKSNNFCVQNFLLHEEKCIQLPTLSKTKNKVSNVVKELYIYIILLIYDENDIENSYGILVSNATAKWKQNQTVNSLEEINLIVKPDQFIAIIGQVGAGKV